MPELSESFRSDALEYLGAKDHERLCPALESYLAKAIDRLENAQSRVADFPDPIAWTWRAMLIESWLVFNPQPLWPKDYVPAKEASGSLVFAPQDARPEWMKRRWI